MKIQQVTQTSKVITLSNEISAELGLSTPLKLQVQFAILSSNVVIGMEALGDTPSVASILKLAQTIIIDFKVAVGVGVELFEYETVDGLKIGVEALPYLPVKILTELVDHFFTGQKLT